MAEEEFSETIEVEFSEENSEMEIFIDCPVYENSSIPAFGAFGRSPDDVFEEFQEHLKEERIDLEIMSEKNFINPGIKAERDELLKIISKS